MAVQICQFWKGWGAKQITSLACERQGVCVSHSPATLEATQGQLDGLCIALPNTHTTRIEWHLWEIDLRFAPGLLPGCLYLFLGLRVLVLVCVLVLFLLLFLCLYCFAFSFSFFITRRAVAAVAQKSGHTAGVNNPLVVIESSVCSSRVQAHSRPRHIFPGRYIVLAASLVSW